jgi:hypothetical protein
MSSLPFTPHPVAEVVAAGPFAELQAADSVHEVIAVTRAFVQSWSAPEILRLPYYCRPGRISDAKEIQELAFLLERARTYFSGRLVDAMVLDRMATFFSAAARALDRVGQL